VVDLDASSELGKGYFRRGLRSTIHFFSYHLVMRRRTVWRTQAAGMKLAVRPTVFHPGYFISSERFADFIGTLDLRGKRTLDVGAGTGILAIAAARAGSEAVIATDINPNAVLSVPENARANAVDAQITSVCMDLLGGFARRPLFDVIVANLPKHSKEPWDLADRGWHSGERHRAIHPFFEQAYDRLKPGGYLYVMLSSHSELGLIEALITGAGFQFKIARRYSIFIESFVLYECVR
jgi:methylase of polypeptide subunit release factors